MSAEESGGSAGHGRTDAGEAGAATVPPARPAADQPVSREPAGGQARSSIPALAAAAAALSKPAGWSLLVKLAIALPLLVMLVAGGLLSAAIVHYTIRFPDPTALKRREAAPVIRILARDGSLIAERGHAHGFVPVDLLPRHVIDAVVATEDHRFFEHWGVDPVGLLRAMAANVRAGRFAQGGSTLTQQLAKNLFLTSERTLERKLEELVLAIWLEVRLSKAEILELYLNRVYFGGGAYGIEAAAHRYFGKPARALDLAEAAVLAGVLKAPSRFSPAASPGLARRRARVVLARMASAGIISAASRAAAAERTVRFADGTGGRDAGGLEWAIDYVLDRLPPLLAPDSPEIIVQTTIDAELQRRAQAVVEATLAREGAASSASQAALVVLDTEGGIRALVGGRSFAQSQFNRAVRARRQPGSSFKPFVYLAAVEQGAGPESMVLDLPVEHKGWSPRNEGGQHRGAMTMRHALAHSVNTAAVRVQLDTGTARVIATARRLGIRSELHSGPSLALGTSEVTLMEMAGAYAVLASGGIEVEPHVVTRVRTGAGRVLLERALPQPRILVAPDHVGAISSMLGSAIVSGTGRRAALPRHPAAGKTGTSQDYRDAWFVGYTAALVAGVWVGNDDGAPMSRVSGGSIPAQIWRDVMISAHNGLPPRLLPGTATSRSGPRGDGNGTGGEAEDGAPLLLPADQIDADFIARAVAGLPEGKDKVSDARPGGLGRLLRTLGLARE